MFETIVMKWKKISTTFMATSFFEHTKKRPACKDKWGIISGDFKKVFSYMLQTTHNQNYWTLSPQEKVTFHLPKKVPKNFYDPLLKFMGIKPIYNPPHVQDLMGDVDVI
jgi:hypothetical protein